MKNTHTCTHAHTGNRMLHRRFGPIVCAHARISLLLDSFPCCFEATFFLVATHFLDTHTHTDTQARQFVNINTHTHTHTHTHALIYTHTYTHAGAHQFPSPPLRKHSFPRISGLYYSAGIYSEVPQSCRSPSLLSMNSLADIRYIHTRAHSLRHCISFSVSICLTATQAHIHTHLRKRTQIVIRVCASVTPVCALCMCAYVCVHVWTYVCAYRSNGLSLTSVFLVHESKSVQMGTNVCASAWVSVLCVFLCVCLCVCVCINIFQEMCVFVYAWILKKIYYTCVCVCVCVG